MLCLRDVQKGGKKPVKSAKTSSGAALVLNEERGGGVINDADNMLEVNRQKGLTITGDQKKIPEWMKGQAQHAHRRASATQRRRTRSDRRGQERSADRASWARMLTLPPLCGASLCSQMVQVNGIKMSCVSL